MWITVHPLLANLVQLRQWRHWTRVAIVTSAQRSLSPSQSNIKSIYRLATLSLSLCFRCTLHQYCLRIVIEGEKHWSSLRTPLWWFLRTALVVTWRNVFPSHLVVLMLEATLRVVLSKENHSFCLNPSLGIALTIQTVKTCCWIESLLESIHGGSKSFLFKERWNFLSLRIYLRKI